MHVEPMIISKDVIREYLKDKALKLKAVCAECKICYHTANRIIKNDDYITSDLTLAKLSNYMIVDAIKTLGGIKELGSEVSNTTQETIQELHSYYRRNLEFIKSSSRR